MLIVAGHLMLDAEQRDAFVASSIPAVAQARAADGCLDFAVSPDPVDRRRVNVFERWDALSALTSFRASGDPDDATSPDFGLIRENHVAQFELG